MTESQRLLADYSKSGSETAFREIVARYVDLTYSTALRVVNGDTHLAQDVTQEVFMDLARAARSLSREIMLGGWLHRHACFVAQKAMRSRRRRAAREKYAIEMNALVDSPAPSLSDMAPVLDEAIEQLGTEDRAAIVLRFFEQREFRAVGAVLGLSENTARMRVHRALEKLGKILKRRGITCTAAALGTALSANAVTSAPAGMAVTIASAALAGASKGAATSLGFLKIMSLTKVQIGCTTLLIAGLTTTIFIQRQSNLRIQGQTRNLEKEMALLRADNAGLSNRVNRLRRVRDPRLPAPVVPAHDLVRDPAEDLRGANVYDRYKDSPPKLSVEQVEGYLKENRRNASSLLAAYRTTGNGTLLAEAMRSFPNDPQVAFEAAFKKDATPEERRQWLDAMSKGDPGNSLPNYLLASEYFKAGKPDEAVRELIAATGKPQFQDYTLSRMQDDEEAYLTAGYSVAEAKTIPGMQLLLPQLAQMKELGLSLVDLSKSYRQNGDDASAQSALQMATELGQRYGNNPAETEISWLVGMAVERMALKGMDPNSPYGAEGQTVESRLNQLEAKNAELKELNAQLDPVLSNMSNQDWIVYKDRWLAFGEESAIRWAVNKYGQK